MDQRLRLCAFTANLLRLGGDCSIYVKVFSNTLWGDFLTQMTWILWYDEAEAEDYERSDIKRVYAMTTKAFLEHEADVHVTTYREVAVKIWGLGPHNSQVARGAEYFNCFEENTALYAIQQFGDIPEFEMLVKQILDKGGIASSRWTHIALNGSRPYKISEQQSRDFKAAFRGYGVSDDGSDESAQNRRISALEIARLYKEICEGEENDELDLLDGHASREIRMKGESYVDAHLHLRTYKYAFLWDPQYIQI